MPRVQENAPGILPSRSISRGSLISTITTSGSCAALMASAALTVSMAALASSIRDLMPRWMVWGIFITSLFKPPPLACPGRGAAFFTMHRRAETHIAASQSMGPGSAAHRQGAALRPGHEISLPHQFLHRAFEALDRDRVHTF